MIATDCSLSSVLQAGLGAVFQPHGLGHFLGLDVHDVNGYPVGGVPRPTKPGVNKLRTARVLQKDMVLTIEPGCYFIDHVSIYKTVYVTPLIASHRNEQILTFFRRQGVFMRRICEEHLF